MKENYDLGKVTRIEEVSGGYCNKSYAVWMTTNEHTHRYFLRLYNPNVIYSEILFEHALLKHLRSNGFTLAAGIVECRNGETIAQSSSPHNHWETRALWALFEFLAGEDKYSWTHTDLTDKEFVSAAEILAHLHHCAHGFKKPSGADRAQPRIMELIPTFKTKFAAFLGKADDRRCDRLLKKNLDLIRKSFDHAVSFEARLQGMPQIPIHCDYHPGNLKFEDEKVIGIFDFDWSKIDYRLFDVALALVYFTGRWCDQAIGLRPDQFSLFLGTYNQACRRLAHISPMTEQEQKHLIPMLSIANLYVLNWELVDYYDTVVPDDDTYYKFIDHHIGLMQWIRSNGDELELWAGNSFKQAGA
ncbi:MAG: phosphotransferase [Desulfobacterales bacterium]